MNKPRRAPPSRNPWKGSCQRLVRSADGNGRRLALEIGVGTTRLKDAIADPKTGDIEDIIADGEYYGMRTFQQDASAWCSPVRSPLRSRARRAARIRPAPGPA